MKVRISADDELTHTRQMLNSRYDDLKSGRVQGIDSKTARRQSLARLEARHNGRQGIPIDGQ